MTYREIALYDEDGIWHAVDETTHTTGDTKMEALEEFIND